MNSEQALTQVEEAIKNRPISNTNKWYLAFIDGKFRLQPTHTNPPVWPIVYVLSEDDVRAGLKNVTWTLIKNRIAKLIVIGAEICPHQKP